MKITFQKNNNIIKNGNSPPPKSRYGWGTFARKWIKNPDQIGEHLFSFDNERIFNLFKDYPHELTAKQKEIFDRKNPYWAEFFKDRN